MSEHFVIKNIRRSIVESRSRKGMIVGLPEIRIPASHAEVLLGEIDRLTAQLDASQALLAEAEDKAFKREARIMMYVNQLAERDEEIEVKQRELDEYYKTSDHH